MNGWSLLSAGGLVFCGISAVLSESPLLAGAYGFFAGVNFSALVIYFAIGFEGRR